MTKEQSITIETHVVHIGDEYFVRIMYDGKQHEQFGPFADGDAARDLASTIARTARATIAFFLETQQWPMKVPA
ncbi:hypothetical protein [Hyphomicrobium sp. DY-1]|uniref:hypothetical protein n=1 Tax=Hyphomicrobium sp. DY-1 TaxID=3075650 RepID=UPI0039C01CFF